MKKHALSILLALATGSPMVAALLEGQRTGRTYVQIDKIVVPDDYEPVLGGQASAPSPPDILPLPADVVDLLGQDSVDYPGYAAAWIESANLPALEEALDKEGLRWLVGLDASIDMPHRRIDPTDPASRVRTARRARHDPVGQEGASGSGEARSGGTWRAGVLYRPLGLQVVLQISRRL